MRGDLEGTGALRHNAQRTLSGSPIRLLELIAGAQPIELLTVEYPAVKMRRPDLVFRLPNGEMRHIELQSGNDHAMDWRMLEYYPLLYRQFGASLCSKFFTSGRGA